MEFDNSFEVPLPPAQAWALLTDIQRIAPCLPGAQLTDVLDDKTYKGRVSVRLGPVALTFAGTVKFEEMDEANRRARVKAQGSDAKGRGGANATSSFHIEPAGAGSKVLVHTNLALSGAVAQYGRGVGMIQATAEQIMLQFAANLRAQLAASGTAAASPPEPVTSKEAGAALMPAAPVASMPLAPAASPPPQAVSPLPAAKPISGFTLMMQVLWRAIRRWFGGSR